MPFLILPNEDRKDELKMKALYSYFDEMFGLENKNGFSKYYVRKEGKNFEETQVVQVYCYTNEMGVVIITDVVRACH